MAVVNRTPGSFAARPNRPLRGIEICDAPLPAPDDAEATHFLGVCLLRSGRRDEGLPLVERSVRLAPRNALYRQNFGLLLAEAGELAAAEQSFRDIIALDAENADGAQLSRHGAPAARALRRRSPATRKRCA